MLKKNEKDTEKILSAKEKEKVSKNSKKEKKKRNVVIFVRIPSLVLSRQAPGGSSQCHGGRN